MGRKSSGWSVVAALYCATCTTMPAISATENVPASGSFEVGKFGDLVTDAGQRLPTLFRRIDKTAILHDWPLRSDAADIGCSLSRPQTSVIIVVDGTPWALNDATKAWVRAAAPSLMVGNESVHVVAGDEPEPWLAPLSATETSPRSLAPLLDVARRMGCMARPVPGTAGKG